MPGEVILPLTGVAAAATGVVAWPAAAACATAGGLLADQLTYWLGRWLARRRGDRPAAPGRFARPAAVAVSRLLARQTAPGRAAHRTRHADAPPGPGTVPPCAPLRARPGQAKA